MTYGYLDGDIRMHDFPSLNGCTMAKNAIENNYPNPKKLHTECLPKDPKIPGGG